MLGPYCTVMAERTLKATQAEYEALEAALVDEEHDELHGFELHYRDGELHVCAPEYGSWDELPPSFLTLLGSLIAKNNLNYLEFGAAFFCLRTIVGSSGGTYFRIRKDGSLSEPKLCWRASRRRKQRPQKAVPKATEADQPTISQQTEIMKQGSSGS
jgi:Uma2 family endonuclease